METVNMLKAELALGKLNQANRARDYTPITEGDDPRIQLSKLYNDLMATLTPAERAALLAKWGY